MSRKINERALALKIEDVTGWLLICKDDDADDWHIAWLEPFGARRSALDFAKTNNWPKPYRAIRGRIMIDPQ